MEQLRKFLRVKRKSEYHTDIGRIKLSKRDKTKISNFKRNKSISPFLLERENSTRYVCDTRTAPLDVPRSHKETEDALEIEKKMNEAFLTRYRRRRKRIDSQIRVEDVEDLWEHREGESEGDRKLSRKTTRPSFSDAYTDASFHMKREDIWRSVHFYRESVRRPRVYTSEIQRIEKKIEPVSVKVPPYMEVPTKAFTTTKYKENIRDILSLQNGIWQIAVHSSSLSIRDAEGYMPNRTIRLKDKEEDVLIRVAYLSPDEEKIAVLTFDKGIVIVAVDDLLNTTEQETDREIDTLDSRVFPDKTFRKGAWHSKSVYFSAIVHGQVIIFNSKKKRGMVFYKGIQNIQQVEFHPTQNILIMVAPSNIFFHGISTQKRETKNTINHISSANTVSLSFAHGLLYVGTGLSQIQVFSLDNECKTEFIRVIYTRGIPRKVNMHETYGYASVFDRTPTILVYANRGRKDLPPRERAGAIHKYEDTYRSGLFHKKRPLGLFSLSNSLLMLHSEGGLPRNTTAHAT
ncbi:hypothetical protein NEFER03_1841 [Nematocida sp. LUAm3]|nr:hypothetical protein NEFER03_1841 [Nematocida sp. LUAm3]KAI5174009.1 hypothetical protein NEFER02_0476 [Nematocida sp. LUAm2]KAI5177247.1 hypothetical protein NEFER01_0522 [Nematocida sp. LUAm1]